MCTRTLRVRARVQGFRVPGSVAYSWGFFKYLGMLHGFVALRMS